MGIIYNSFCRIFQSVFKAASYLLNWTEPELIIGPGVVNKLPEIIKDQGIDNILLVTDKVLMELKLPEPLIINLKKIGIACTVYDGTMQNPTIQNVQEAKDLYLKNNCKAIIAFGGGSPMDCAKLTGSAIARPKKSITQMRGLFKVRKTLPPLYAIPTTAGTGSETTIVAVVTNSETHEKYPVNDPKLRPKYAVLDAKLTETLPPHITAATGLDALTHAVEAFINKSNTKKTSASALKAAKMVFENLEKVYINGENIEAREKMLLASYYAGIAFTRAYVGYVHAIAHNLGGLYNIPHGLANAIILPYVLDYYGTAASKKLSVLADTIGLGNNEDSEDKKAALFIEEIRRLNKKLNIPEKINDLQEKDIELIAHRALKEANPLYPVPKIMDLDDCISVIYRLLP